MVWNQAEWLKPGRTANKLAKWFASDPNDMKAVQAQRTNSLWLEQYENLPNYLPKHALLNKQDCPTRNTSADRILKATAFALKESGCNINIPQVEKKVSKWKKSLVGMESQWHHNTQSILLHSGNKWI